MQKYKLEKSVWTQDDFEVMGWHDVNIYGMIIEKSKELWQENLIFDIDYIFEWVHPTTPLEYFSFWVAPCTLIFKEVSDLKINIDYQDYSFDLLTIYDLYLISKHDKENGVTIYEWHLKLQEGEIRFKSLGFDQIVRKEPMSVRSQVLDLIKREGISFNKKSFEEKI